MHLKQTKQPLIKPKLVGCKLILLAGLLGSGLSGCATSNAPAQFADKLESQNQSTFIKVTALNSKIQDGFLTVQMEVTNIDSQPRRTMWRVKWLDENNFQVWEDEVWKPVLIGPQAKQNIQLVSPTAKARDFRVQFAK